jgi:hypothetical protein
MKLTRSGLAGALVVGPALAIAAVIGSTPAIGQVAKDAGARVLVIEEEGDHTLFEDDHTALVAAVHAESGDLQYTVAVRNKTKGRATLTVAPKKTRKGWFMVAEGPSVWVFDGDQTVTLFKRTIVDDTPGIDSKTAKEFPEIMKSAPKLFVDRLPPAMRK